MRIKVKPFVGGVKQPASARLIVAPTRASSPPVAAAARRDELAVIAERVDALSELVLKLQKEVKDIRRSSRGRRQTKKPATSQLCFNFWDMAAKGRP
jgi:hypothetical protein